MLIEFSVSNFRSFREKQTFSMVAAQRLRKKENTFNPDLDEEKFPRLLKVVAIYGPNASGKSNLIRALFVVGRIAGLEPSADPAPLPVSPFRFDKGLLNEPSNFEVHFIQNRVRYQFNLSATGERITHESLFFYPKGKETILYDRTFNGSKDEYSFGALEGGEALHSLWVNSTGSKTLFISRAVANSSENLKQLAEPFFWLKRGLFSLDGNMSLLARASQNLAKQQESYGSGITQFLNDLDVPITKIRFDEDGDTKPLDLTDTKVIEESLGKSVKTTLTHETRLGEADFDFSEESDGTKNLVGFYLPWGLLNSRKRPIFYALLVDELDRSLHPQIVRALVEQHIQNNDPSQLIFTTHDTHLMDTKLLRRDQFWLTERDYNGATVLRSVYDFEGRESEDIEKRYFAGRYRGLPIIRRK